MGEILLEDGLLTNENIQEALLVQEGEGGLLGRILLQQGHISEEQLIGALGKQLKVPFIALQNYSINMDAVRLFDADFCREHAMVAFDVDEQRIYLAVSDPLHCPGVERARQETKKKPQVFMSTSGEILELIDLANASQSKTKKLKKAG
ncbi:MAG: hypothetical protein Q8R76_11360 [Candidatus Omnitrophota bacterium]|nr:hypothetical protein [Candidatus Omnitrophota bacterium]